MDPVSPKIPGIVLFTLGILTILKPALISKLIEAVYKDVPVFFFYPKSPHLKSRTGFIRALGLVIIILASAVFFGE
ncbi:MAG: hypothetical protein SWH61_04065 [Thermodesulfobacteriota bacterium]|nr:hypothetical protein [Thermodesulfobacteriota bacterium]